jgi:hypothetical protein
MKQKIFVVILFVYSIAVSKLAAQTVALDYYFNHETRTSKGGVKERYHYLWEDTTNTGFYKLGVAFKARGASLATITARPNAVNLKNADVYIIVDPDSKKENSDPNYIQPADADEIAKWVKKGGVLILLANDSANVELTHFNLLANRFGMHFNNDMQNHVIDDTHFEDGAVIITNNPVFKTTKKAFMKDVCSIGLSGNAKRLLKSTTGATIAAIIKYGKGTVIAVGDPWLYNEYVNGRLPVGFDNDKAANDLVNYVIAKKRAL